MSQTTAMNEDFEGRQQMLVKASVMSHGMDSETPVLEILSMIGKFTQMLCATFQGTGGCQEIMLENRASYEEFMKAICATAPNFAKDEGGKDVCDSDAIEPCALQNIRQIIQDSMTWELPGNVPIGAKRCLIKKFTDLWTSSALFCFEEVLGRLEYLLQCLILNHFGNYQKLQDYISSLVRERLEQIRESALVMLKNTLRIEQEFCFTQNMDDFNRKRDSWLARFTVIKMERVHGRELRDDIKPLESPVLRAPIQPHPFHAELSVMAEVRAYFHISHKRIIDYVPLTIELFLNRAMCDGLQNWLVQKLDIDGNDALARHKSLLEQDPQAIVHVTRARLAAELSELDNAGIAQAEVI